MKYLVTCLLTYPEQPLPAGPITVSLRGADEQDASRNLVLSNVSSGVCHELQQLMRHREEIEKYEFIAWLRVENVSIDRDEPNGAAGG